MSAVAAWAQRRNRRHAARIDAQIDGWLTARSALDLRGRWREACTRAGLGRPVFTPLGGMSVAGLPQVVHTHPGERFGDPAYLIVTLPPGMLIDDLEDRADDLASGLGCWGVRFAARGVDHVRVDLIAADPLSQTVTFPLPCPAGHLAFGVDEHAAVVSRPLAEVMHIAVQGSTDSGKSATAYALLAQLATFGNLVEVCGIDPTGLLLGPWGEHPDGLRVNGTATPTATGTASAADRYTAVLRRLVDDMDARIATLPALQVDRLPITPATPLRFVVLEELAAISRLTGYRTGGVASEAQKLIGRLASEGRKGGYRLLIISQRLGSDVLATDTRDQLRCRLTLGTHDLATVRMLSPDATPEDLTPLTDAPAGTALADLRGEPMRRIRAPWIGGYRAYCDHVSSHPAASGSAAA